MKAVVQRVVRASVTSEGVETGSIGIGLMILLGVARGDTEEDARHLADRCAGLRVFDDEEGRMNRSLLDVDGAALVVSQFTLYGDTGHGRRPSYVEAAPPETAEPLYLEFMEALHGCGVKKVESGRFRTEMKVYLENDGPVTLILESKKHNPQAREK